MNLLIKILQAAHCRSTHQFFVMDALPLVTSPRAQRLASVLLKYHEAYLIGSKDPDKTFRDFRNHVLHVGDNLWGGATKSADNWYAKLQRELDGENWQEAAYAAGVLSHYFTDPLMPLHTAQSEKESIVHRPLEWSVTKSYARIFQRWQSGKRSREFVLPHGEDWLSIAITRGATVAHSYYHELIDRYDLAAGVKNPPMGFDNRSIDILSTMFGIAISGWAQVIQRAADESRAAIPNMPLRLTTVVATLNMPSAWITRRIESSEERAAVQAIFDEYKSTGTVQENLPPEVATVRQERKLDSIRKGENPNAPVAPTDTTTAAPVSSVEAQPIAQPATAKPEIAKPPIAEHPLPVGKPKPVPKRTAGTSVSEARLAEARRRRDESRAAGLLKSPIAGLGETEAQRDTVPMRPSHDAPTPSRSRTQPPTLSVTDDLVDAPSIGPKTARRFAKINIATVAEFLAASPEQMAADLDTRWITTEKLRDWQAQAKLVCDVASLCGYKSQLLVGVGCRNTPTLARQNAAELHELICDFAQTSDGSRILRSSNPPPADDVQQWVADAAQVVTRRQSA